MLLDGGYDLEKKSKKFFIINSFGMSYSGGIGLVFQTFGRSLSRREIIS